MEHKTFDLVEVKADGEQGEFSALASVFGNVDLVGDRMLPGAFSKTLEKWRATGKPIPVIWSHDWDDPMKYVGKADPRAVVETDEGLLVQGHLDVGNGNPLADQVYRLMKQDLVTGWSFGYTVPKGGQKRANGANEVSEVDLVEVGPTLKGANPLAQSQAVKSFAVEVKMADRMRSMADEIADDDPAIAARMREFASEVAEMSVRAAKTSEKEAPPTPAPEVEDAGEEPDGAKPKAQDPLADSIDLAWLSALSG